MTSIAAASSPQANTSNANNSSPAHARTPSSSGQSTSAVVPANAPAPRAFSYANAVTANKQTPTGPGAASSSKSAAAAPSVSGAVSGQHARSASTTSVPVNGKIQPAVPINTAPNGVSTTSYTSGGQQNRKSSVATANMPNGSSRGAPNIKFGDASNPQQSGSASAAGSNLTAPMANPRASSPAPAAAAQPVVSGGQIPPTGARGIQFGDATPQQRPVSMPPQAHVPQGPGMGRGHNRHESAQSHNEQGPNPNHGGRGGRMGMNRGGYNQQYQGQAYNYGGRGNFQAANQQRGGPPSMVNAGQPYPNQQYPSSPRAIPRSPGIAHVQPHQSPSMAPVIPANATPQLFPPHHAAPPYPTGSPALQYQTLYPADPSAGYYQPYAHPMAYPTPYPTQATSPRPGFAQTNHMVVMPGAAQPFYPIAQGQAMSRSNSTNPGEAMHRPQSSMSQHPQPPMTPQPQHIMPQPAGTPSSAASFQVAPKKKTSSAIAIKDPNSGKTVVPVPAAAPVIVSSFEAPATATTRTETTHIRTGSTSADPQAENKRAMMRQQVLAKKQASEEAEKAEKARLEEEAAKKVQDDAKRQQEEAEAEAKAKADAEEAKKREEEEKAKAEQEAAAATAAAKAAEEQALKDAEAKAQRDADEKEKAAKEAEEKAKAEAEAESSKPTEETAEPKETDEPALPSAALTALRSARPIETLKGLEYPEGIQSPNPALNPTAAPAKFRYDKDFLMQFQTVFTDKPSTDWDERMSKTIGDIESARPGVGSRTPSGMASRSTSSRGSSSMQPSMGAMGSFGSGSFNKPLGTSMERFQASSKPAMGMMGGMGLGGQRPGPLARTGSSASLAGAGSNNPASPRTNNRSARGNSKRGTAGAGGASMERSESRQQPSQPTIPLADVKPLPVSANRWQPRSVKAAADPAAAATAAPGSADVELMQPDMVQRKVKAALNKMTPEKFDKISDQILEITAQSKHESDGRTLRQVIQLTFDKACDEAHWASMYAKFCKKMLETMDSDIKDENIKDKAGQVVTGGNLFRKYLLNRCQEEFERGWKVNLPPTPEGVSEEVMMLSDEYYIAAAAKRKGLGLVQFIGELFKLNMLTERIMNECVRKLLDFEGLPEDETVESLSKLLRTIGVQLDSSERSKPLMDQYFGRIQAMVDNKELNSRMRFMLMDVIDLRKTGWDSKETDKGPKTIQEIHEEAIRAQAEKAAASQASRSNRPQGGRENSYRGHGQYGGPPPATRDNLSAHDLAKLGTRARNSGSSMSTNFGPSTSLGPRGSAGGSGSRRGLGPRDDSGLSSRAATPPVPQSTATMNPFHALANADSGDGHDAVSPPPQTEASNAQPATEESS
ncbi:Similar to Eukaryotic translation initiation factor 4 gamma; acc. no. Q10475 [Pyronema omphalodes CBS 100304]|uniref:Similar to Eukaryotic translation initiation factor 4 gamma acc. no. Q10475 n=1 Tax=Pyronema omphalodes (strain CBS 100304) TaxID=1076935 RepID=U4LHD5_PYROM|nr:Similar to Eukaryotic translation initiation factor 4 gamma; acc. no. Q10475 [Pyronema omphalodes CBS 100304]